MQILLSFAGLIALLSFATMCIYVVIALKDSRIFLKNATDSLQQTVKIVQQMEVKLAVTLETANDTLENTSITFNNIDKQIELFDKGLNHFNAVAKRVDELEMSIQKKIEGPLMQAASIVSGVSKAVSAFGSSWSKGKR
ncbi:MAG: hypothetical protein JST20_07410 [Bacteroidetes bacterium]|nr:hypothetical protein [Bacteroidota bacterium]